MNDNNKSIPSWFFVVPLLAVFVFLVAAYDQFSVGKLVGGYLSIAAALGQVYIFWVIKGKKKDKDSEA